jgi:RNase P subunit RPR2
MSTTNGLRAFCPRCAATQPHIVISAIKEERVLVVVIECHVCGHQKVEHVTG